jgi:hypothetical protein
MICLALQAVVRGHLAEPIEQYDSHLQRYLSLPFEEILPIDMRIQVVGLVYLLLFYQHLFEEFKVLCGLWEV